MHTGDSHSIRNDRRQYVHEDSPIARDVRILELAFHNEPNPYSAPRNVESTLCGEVPLNANRCKAKNKRGEQCRAIASRDGFCSMHSQAGRAAELGRRSGEARKAPESEPLFLIPPKTGRDLHNALGQIFAKVSSGEMDLRIGRTLGYIGSVLVKTTEMSDHEVRLRTLEELITLINSERTQQ